MKSINLRSRRGFSPTIELEGRIWRKVRNIKHRDELEESNEYVFTQCSDDSMKGGFSFHLYYTEWFYIPSKADIRIIIELDEMLEFFTMERDGR
jgi:hypothetical protein